jgi:hypothetical protein
VIYTAYNCSEVIKEKNVDDYAMHFFNWNEQKAMGKIIYSPVVDYFLEKNLKISFLL